MITKGYSTFKRLQALVNVGEIFWRWTLNCSHLRQGGSAGDLIVPQTGAPSGCMIPIVHEKLVVPQNENILVSEFVTPLWGADLGRVPNRNSTDQKLKQSRLYW